MKTNLPNSQTVYILGLISIIGGFFSSGIIGFVCSIVGLQKYKSDKQLYNLNPMQYEFESYTNLQNGRTMCIIGLVLSIFMLLGILLFVFFIFGMAFFTNSLN